MPRNGSGVYSEPAGTQATANTTIESSKYNAFVQDLVSDANTARPITVGGTDATTAVGAHDNLSTKGTNILSATTTDIGAATGQFVHVTGTTTITGLGTKTAGVRRTVTFDGILTLTHNATSLILPGAANITTEAGDTAVFVSEGSGNWRCVTYNRAASLVDIPAGVSTAVPVLTGVAGVLSSSKLRLASTLASPGDDTLTFKHVHSDAALATQVSDFMVVTTTDAGVSTVSFPDNHVGTEGSLTVGMTFGGSASGVTFSTNSGAYTRIGDRVFFDITIVLTNNGSGTGTALVTGLPIAAASSGMAVSCQAFSGFSGLTAGVSAYVLSGSTTIALAGPNTTGSTTLTDTNVTNTASFYLCGSYRV